MSKHDPTSRYKFIVLLCIVIPFCVLFIWFKDTHIESKPDNTSISKTSFVSNQNLANPASVYCAQKGGTNSIITLGNGAQDGLCNFADNMSCEQWAMYRGECPIGGVKTTGYDDEGQRYCAWLGGKTLAVENSQCTLPNGTVCSTADLYAGSCN